MPPATLSAGLLPNRLRDLQLKFGVLMDGLKRKRNAK